MPVTEAVIDDDGVIVGVGADDVVDDGLTPNVRGGVRLEEGEGVCNVVCVGETD